MNLGSVPLAGLPADSAAEYDVELGLVPRGRPRRVEQGERYRKVAALAPEHCPPIGVSVLNLHRLDKLRWKREKISLVQCICKHVVYSSGAPPVEPPDESVANRVVEVEANGERGGGTTKPMPVRDVRSRRRPRRPCDGVRRAGVRGRCIPRGSTSPSMIESPPSAISIARSTTRINGAAACHVCVSLYARLFL